MDFVQYGVIGGLNKKLNYPDVNSKDLALKLIEIIKIKNIKFKNLI